jgi:hypothetical protein
MHAFNVLRGRQERYPSSRSIVIWRGFLGGLFDRQGNAAGDGSGILPMRPHRPPRARLLPYATAWSFYAVWAETGLSQQDTSLLGGKILGLLQLSGTDLKRTVTYRRSNLPQRPMEVEADLNRLDSARHLKVSGI